MGPTLIVSGVGPISDSHTLIIGKTLEAESYSLASQEITWSSTGFPTIFGMN